MAVQSKTQGTTYGATGQLDTRKKSSCLLFVRVKDLRNINTVTETFDLRWRYFVYFQSDELWGILLRNAKEILGEEAANRSHDDTRKRMRDSEKESRWYVNELNSACETDIAKIIPLPTVHNRFSKLETTSAAEIIYKPKPIDAWCYTEQVAATLSHRFDLEDFPFDAHELKLDYRLNKIPFRECYSLCVAGSFNAESELLDEKERIPWYFYEEKKNQFSEHAREHKLAALEFDQKLTCGPEFDIGAPRVSDSVIGGKPQALFTIAIIRRPRHVIYTMAMESLIATVAFSLVLVKPTEFATRLATSNTILFTTISFSTSVSSNLPKLAYQTFLSLHASMCVLIVIFVILCATTNRLVLSRHYLWIDSIVFGAIFVGWMAYHAWLVMTYCAHEKVKGKHFPIFPPARRN